MSTTQTHVRQTYKSRTLSRVWAFAIQVVWLRHFLGQDVVAALKWLGLRPLPATAGALETALRVKVLILIAVAFKRRSERCGVGKLPECCAGQNSSSKRKSLQISLVMNSEMVLLGTCWQVQQRPGWLSLPTAFPASHEQCGVTTETTPTCLLCKRQVGETSARGSEACGTAGVRLPPVLATCQGRRRGGGVRHASPRGPLGLCPSVAARPRRAAGCAGEQVSVLRSIMSMAS